MTFLVDDTRPSASRHKTPASLVMTTRAPLLMTAVGPARASAMLLLALLACSSTALHSAAFQTGRPRLAAPHLRPLSRSQPLRFSEGVALNADNGDSQAVEQEEAGHHADIALPGWLTGLRELEAKGLGSVTLLAATALSMGLANLEPTSASWLGLWEIPVGPAVGGHVLSVRGWINEGLMAIFFFFVGLEIKMELRQGSLASIRKAILPCIAAVGGMVTPMLVYFITQGLFGGGTLAALAVPMATDIAFAMAIFGFFRNRMPAAASAFLLTLATVDDLGAIVVLAVFYASNVVMPYLAASAAVTAGLATIGNKKMASLPAFAIGGAILWFCLLSAGVNSDIAGAITGMCVSTQAVRPNAEGKSENFLEQMTSWLSPLSCFFIMPLFALANTAVKLGGGVVAESIAPAAGIGAGLLIGKPIGIFCFTMLACKIGLASLPSGMSKRHVSIVGILGAIGFTMCLLLTEVSLPASLRTMPKLSVLASSSVAAILGAIGMRMQPVISAKTAEA